MGERRLVRLHGRDGEKVAVGVITIDGRIPPYAMLDGRFFAYFTAEAQGRLNPSILLYRELPEPSIVQRMTDERFGEEAIRSGRQR